MRDWLRNKREGKKLSQSEVARSVGISQNHYSSIETGVRRPSPEVAQKIANELEFDWILFFEKDITA